MSHEMKKPSPITRWVVYWAMGRSGHEVSPMQPIQTTEKGQAYTELTIPADWVVMLVNYRRTRRDMRQLVELSYSASVQSLDGKIAYAKNPKGCGFRAEASLVQDIVHCGSDPILIAELGKDIHIQRDERGKEYLVFKRRELNPDLQKEINEIIEANRRT